MPKNTAEHDATKMERKDKNYVSKQDGCLSHNTRTEFKIK